MALSYVTYSASGSDTDYTITFDYLLEAYVKVYLDGVLKTITTDYTFFNATTIRFNSTVTASVVIRLERATLNTTRLVDFQDAGNLTEADLDQSADQLFHLQQELIDDITDNSMVLDTDNQWDAESHPIKNLSDPTNAQDASTKAYTDAGIASQVAAAEAAQAAAELAETGAEAAQAAAELAETGAETAETNAAASYDSFDDRYLGSKASDPTLDNDGNALLTGAIYWNSTTDDMRVYSGSAWSDVALKQLQVFQALTTSGVNSNQTLYVNSFGSTTLGATEPTRGGVSRAGTLKNLRIACYVNNFSASTVVVTVRVNGVDTSLVVTIPALTETTVSNVTDTASVSQGDIITLEYSNSGGGAKEFTDDVTFQFELESP